MLLNYQTLKRELEEQFREAGIEETADIDWIMVEVTGINRSALPMFAGFTEEQADRIMDAAEQRINHVPLAYIFGESEFCGRRFKVTADTLIPRQDTEVVVEDAVSRISKWQKKSGKKATVLDMGTGSGAIAITIQKETGADVLGTDISEEALKVAAENADRLKSKTKFLNSNLFSKLKGNTFDFIVSNPPYVETKVFDTLEPEVRLHEPKLALDGGEDGLDFYRKIIKAAPKHLNAGGTIIFEIGYNQAKEVSSLLEKDFEDVEILKDYGGNPRVCAARLK